MNLVLAVIPLCVHLFHWIAKLSVKRAPTKRKRRRKENTVLFYFIRTVSWGLNNPSKISQLRTLGRGQKLILSIGSTFYISWISRISSIGLTKGNYVRNLPFLFLNGNQAGHWEERAEERNCEAEEWEQSIRDEIDRAPTKETVFTGRSCDQVLQRKQIRKWSADRLKKSADRDDHQESR